jgi:hypothetical protein
VKKQATTVTPERRKIQALLLLVEKQASTVSPERKEIQALLLLVEKQASTVNPGNGGSLLLCDVPHSRRLSRRAARLQEESGPKERFAS